MSLSEELRKPQSFSDQLRETMLDAKSSSPMAPPAIILPDRKVRITEQEIMSAIPLLFAEISNRGGKKIGLEARAILNTAFNRMKEYAGKGTVKTFNEVIEAPNQYQGFNSPQYKMYQSGKLDVPSQKKADAISAEVKNIVSEMRGGTFKDNVGGYVYYKHLKDGSIRATPGSLFK